ncbi:hypothetical protein BVC80_9033g29 [Macleaya cordata]|uniref:Uncharacterized protein n=1 Tax=Macleaya cordata TaxID=56857 RepID=A0A200QYQ7_MACCD|nr:hypothetical protein BVC80_9033g29 [Macleaya cordata]
MSRPSLMQQQPIYQLDAVEHKQNPSLFTKKFGQIPPHRQLQQDSSPPDNTDTDDTLVQPTGGGHRDAGNHHGTDLKPWDKQHPKPPS